MTRLRTLVLPLAFLAWAACSEEAPPAGAERVPDAEVDGGASCAHHHAAPHGGVLLPLGDHFAHLELVFEADQGRLTLYVLDGGASSGVRVAQPELRLRIQSESGELPLALEPVARALTGETRGDSSEFSGSAPALRGATRFEATVESIRIKGQDFDGVAISFPAGDH